MLSALLVSALLSCVAAAPPGKNTTGDWLFVIDSSGGTKIAANADGSYKVSLLNVRPRALAFTDKPARDVQLVDSLEQLQKLLAPDAGAPPNFVLVFGEGDEEFALPLTLASAAAVALHGDGIWDDIELNATVIDAQKAAIEWGPRVAARLRDGDRAARATAVLPKPGQPELDASVAPAFLFVDDGDVAGTVACTVEVVLGYRSEQFSGDASCASGSASAFYTKYGNPRVQVSNPDGSTPFNCNFGLQSGTGPDAAQATLNVVQNSDNSIGAMVNGANTAQPFYIMSVQGACGQGREYNNPLDGQVLVGSTAR